MFDQIRPALYITRREVRDQMRDWRIIFPIVGLTLIFPSIMNFTAQQMLNFVSKYGATIIAERLVPFLLMIVGFFPISVSLVIALESFVGEKERNSIEPLLNTPLKDWQLYVGKLLASTVPPLIGSYLGMGIYAAGLHFNHIPLPPADLFLLIVMLTTAQAVTMVSGAVVVSTQATSVRAANLLASFIIIPVSLLIQGESVVMFWGHTYRTLWWAVLGLAILSVLLVRVGLAHFQREELLGKEIDVLNIRWIWQNFSRQFTGGANTPWRWYRVVIPHTMGSLRLPILITFILAMVGVILGVQEIKEFPVHFNPQNMTDMNSRINALLETWPLFSAQPVLAIWWQNLRVMLLSAILGAFSLGILGMLPLMMSMGVMGYLLAILGDNGLPVAHYLLFIIPHGIIEVPAAIIASAAVLKTGAILATPTPGKTIGEVWLNAVADWAKIMTGVVIPMLFVAAVIEAWVTPRLVLWFFR